MIGEVLSAKAAPRVLESHRIPGTTKPLRQHASDDAVRADRAAGYRSRMPSRSARPQLGLFDNPAGAFRLVELTETVRALERQRPGRTVDELSRAVFAELAMKRTRRSAELIAEAIRLARAREPHGEISGSRWQASTAEVRNWALNAGFEISADGSIPDQAITAYNQTHPDHPY